MGSWLGEAGKMFGIQTGQGVIGGMLGNIFGKMQDKRQLELAEKMQNLQEQGNMRMLSAQEAKELRMWEATNFGAQKEQMKKAGLSPGMMYGMGGGGGATIGGSGQSVGSSGGRGGEEAALAATAMGMNLQLLKAQKENIEAGTAKTKVEAQKAAGVDTELAQTQKLDLLQGIENKQAQEQLTRVQTTLGELDAKLKGATLDDMVDLAEYTAGKAEQELEQARFETKVSRGTMDTKIKQARADLAGTYLTNALTKAQEQLAKSGRQVNDQQIAESKARIIKMGQDIAQGWAGLTQGDKKINIDKFRAEVDANFPGIGESIGRIINDGFERMMDRFRGKRQQTYEVNP